MKGKSLEEFMGRLVGLSESQVVRIYGEVLIDQLFCPHFLPVGVQELVVEIKKGPRLRPHYNGRSQWFRQLRITTKNIDFLE